MIKRRSSDSPLNPKVLRKTSFRKPDLIKLRFICANALEKMSSQYLFEVAIEIIKKPPEERMPEEIQILIKATESLPFFQEINKKNIHIRLNTHEKICGRMLYESLKKGQAVMHYGDTATKCYIILKGTVNIYVPRDIRTLNSDISHGKLLVSDSILSKIKSYQEKLNEKQRESIRPFQNYNTSLFNLAVERKATTELNIETIRKLTYDPTYENTLTEDDEKSQSIERSRNNYAFSYVIDPKEFFSEEELEEIERIEQVLGGITLLSLQNPKKYFEGGVFKFHYSGELKQGQMFGEVGLSMKKARSATVICKEDCEFAVLNFQDFKKILQNVEKKTIQSRVEFFKERMFKGIPVDVIIRLSFLFKKKSYFQGNEVFSEGDMANEMFLIKKGEVQIYKKIKEKNEVREESIQDYIGKFRKQNENRLQNVRFLNIPVSNK